MIGRMSATVVLLLLLSSTTAAAGTAVALGTDNRDTVGNPNVSVETSQLDSSDGISHELTISDLEQVRQLSLVVGKKANVVRAVGFERSERSGQTRLEWAGTRDSGRVVIHTAESGAGSASGGPEYFTAETWMLARVPYVSMQWSPADASATRHIRPLGEEYGAIESESNGLGTFGDRYALVGDQVRLTHRAGGQQFHIVTPERASLAADPAAIQQSLSTASRQLQVGDRDDEVLLFALPDPARRGGESFPARDEAWIHAKSQVDTPNSVWLHEYVHTRQSFRLGSQMKWFREASAEYYAARFAYEQSRTSKQAMYRHLDEMDTAATLADPSTWDTPRIPYTKGARVLALLDRNIRENTDGRHSLQDVFRQMNSHQGRVTYEEFKDMVASVAGTSMDAWLDRYVADKHGVPSAYDQRPIEAGLFSMFPAGLTQGQGRVGLAVLLVIIGTGGLVSVPLYAVLQYRSRQTDCEECEPDRQRLLVWR